MPKFVRMTLIHTLLLMALVSLVWYATACGNEEPPEQPPPDTEATIEAAVSAALATRAAAAPEPTATPVPEPTATPQPSPTPTDVPEPTPTTAPEPTPTAESAAPMGASDAEPLTPLPVDDPQAFLAAVSEPERACLTENFAPDRMQQLTMSPELATDEERETMLECLEHDTQLRLLLTAVLGATGPLSADSSMCMRDSYANVDLAELMSGVMTEPGSDVEAQQAMARGMVMFMVSLSCLNEQEFGAAGAQMGMAPGEYEAFQCVVEQAGGPDAMAVLLSPGSEFPAALFQAALACELQMGGPPPSP